VKPSLSIGARGSIVSAKLRGKPWTPSLGTAQAAHERRRRLIPRPPESLDRTGRIGDIDRRPSRRRTTMTSADPNPRQLLTTLMEENPDATEQELFELRHQVPRIA
jgi:hypothetical protein